jgi:hypothetical protein
MNYKQVETTIVNFGWQINLSKVVANSKVDTILATTHIFIILCIFILFF